MLTSDQDFDQFTGLVEAEDVYMNATLRSEVPNAIGFTFSGKAFRTRRPSTHPNPDSGQVGRGAVGANWVRLGHSSRWQRR
jgi:hypothetical protein